MPRFLPLALSYLFRQQPVRRCRLGRRHARHPEGHPASDVVKPRVTSALRHRGRDDPRTQKPRTLKKKTSSGEHSPASVLSDAVASDSRGDHFTLSTWVIFE